MKKIIIALIALAIFSATSMAAVTADYKNSGSVAGSYLELGAGAAASGMANAYTGAANDSVAVFWNPAGLESMNRNDKSWNMFFSHDVWIQDMMMDHFAIAKNFGKAGVAGAGLAYFNAGSTDRYNLDANGGYIADGSYSPYAAIASLAYSNVLDKDIDYGVNLKYVFDNIDGSTAQAMAFDLGVRYFTPLPGLSADITITNFIGRMSDYVLPKEAVFGLFYTAKVSDYTISADYDAVGKVNNDAVHRIGLEIKAPSYLSLRAGYQTDNTGVTEGFKGFTFGTGINMENKYNVDFSYEPYGDLGNSFKISLGADF